MQHQARMRVREARVYCVGPEMQSRRETKASRFLIAAKIIPRKF